MGSEMCIRDRYHLDESGEEAVLAFFAKQERGQGFGNGRTARNLFEASVSRHAVRMVDIAEPTNNELITLTKDDIEGISLVDGPEADSDGDEAAISDGSEHTPEHAEDAE